MRQGSLSPLVLTPKKIASIVSVSEETAARSNLLLATLRLLMGAGLSEIFDSTFFGTAAESATAPAGVLAALSPLTATVGSTTRSDAMRADLEMLLAALSGPVDPVFVTSPSRRLFAKSVLPSGFDYPIIPSTACPSSRCIVVDTAGLVIANGAEPRFDQTISATLVMDTAPPQFGTAGSPNVVGAPSRSMFQTDCIAMRALLDVAWGVRAGAVAYTDGIAW